MKIYDLTDRQELIKKYLQVQAELFGKGFYNAEERGIGKTTIINNLGLEYQSLGYNVIVVTPTFIGAEYIANERWSVNDRDNRSKSFPSNTIVLVDELKISEANSLTTLLKRHSSQEEIKVLGFVRFK